MWKQNMMEETNTARGRYWQANLKCVGVLLSIWFFVSYGCGILLRDWLDANFPNVGTAPFGFWMAQQGAIICFVLLLVSYAFWMKKLDAQFEVDEEEGR
jgi:putative solute:sodium symporter small subunit